MNVTFIYQVDTHGSIYPVHFVILIRFIFLGGKLPKFEVFDFYLWHNISIHSIVTKFNLDYLLNYLNELYYIQSK